MSRNILYIIVEGQTEYAGLTRLLQPHYGNLGFDIACPNLSGRFVWKTFLHQLTCLCKQNPGCFISTCFDFYALGREWPGNSNLPDGMTDKYQIVTYLEEQAAQKVRSKVSGEVLWDGHFIPHIQLHEFETLLFADPAGFAELMAVPGLQQGMEDLVCENGGNCELIDDGFATAPSKRLNSLTRGKYTKGKSSQAQAPLFLAPGRLGILQARCQHFNRWISDLDKAIVERHR